MNSNHEKYKKDLEKLISFGNDLLLSMYLVCKPENFKKQMKAVYKDKYDEEVKKLPDFSFAYQSWYSEALVIVKLLIPDRVDDFKRLYEKQKNRKDIKYGNYVIEDYLQGLQATNGFGEIIVDKSAALPQFQQQFNILKSVQERFSSSLFEIKQLVQADLFDSELEAAKELNKKGFMRGAGAISGVVLEGHLKQVCDNHNIKISKKDPSVSDLNDLLKSAGVLEVDQWRFVQHLADIRNKCDHKKISDPTTAEILSLIEGVEKIIKTIF